MTIANYTELRTSIEGHLRRGDMTSLIPDFITLGESRLNRLVRLLQQETIVSLTSPTASRFLAMPAGFLEIISLTSPSCALEPLSADQMDAVKTDTQGTPTYYRIADQIEFDRPSDAPYVLSMRMLKRWNIATDTTNWLLTNCPDCYVYASLLAASPYLKDDNRILVWKELLMAGVDEANSLDSRTRADTIMTLDSGLSGQTISIYNQ